MNLKNIIKLLIIFIPFFFLSCQKLDNFRNKDEKILLKLEDEIENIETFNNIASAYKKFRRLQDQRLVLALKNEQLTNPQMKRYEKLKQELLVY